MGGVILCILWYGKIYKPFSDFFVLPATWQAYFGRRLPLFQGEKKLHYIDALLLISRWICSWSAATQALGFARASDFSLLAEYGSVLSRQPCSGKSV